MKYLVIFCILITTTIGLCQTLPAKTYWIETDELGRKINTGVVKERYNEDANGSIHGKYISYFSDGTKEKVIDYSHGKINGQYQEYYEDGSIKIKCHYLNDKLNGTYYSMECYSLIGIGTCYGTKMNYLNGKEHGLYEKRKVADINLFLSDKPSSSDILIDKGQYVNGNREGKWIKDRNEDGTYREGMYKLNREEGIWTNTAIRQSAFGPLPYYEKGFKTLFKAGEVIQEWNDKGNDLTEIARKEAQRAKDQQILDARLEAEEKAKEAEKKKLEEANKLLRTPSLNFNMNSYILMDNSLKQLSKFAQNILKYNQANNGKIKDLWILAHTDKGKEDGIRDQRIQEDKLYILSLNRCYMIKKYLIEYGLKDIQLHFLPCAYHLQKGKKVEIYLEESQDVRNGQEICQRITGQAQYNPERILLNQKMRDGVLFNVKQIKNSDIYQPDLKYRVPIELWMDEYSQNELEIEKFKKQLIKVAGGENQVEQYVYPVNFQR